MPPSSPRTSTRWSSRLLPLFLGGCAVFTTYVVVARLCDTYLLKSKRQTGLAIAILVVYFVLLLILLSTYLRLLLVVKFDAGLVPLGNEAKQQGSDARRASKTGKAQSSDVGSVRYPVGEDGPSFRPPGLESFYSKNIFVCESNGRPRWCSECRGFKPDRAHHSSDINRCVYKMDHFCPWVGGMVAENSFKFFFQFNVYATLFCAFALGSTAYGVKTQAHNPNVPLDPTFIATMALAGFFGFFTFIMCITTTRYIFQSLTTVDSLNAGTKVYQLAVRVHRDSKPDNKFELVTYPPPPGPPTHPVPVVEATSLAHEERCTTRDGMATRTFAILRTDAGENPWDLGWKRNWVSVMGSSVLDWTLPVRRSPCTNHDMADSYYPVGPVVDDLRRRYGIDSASDETDKLELRNMRTSNGNAR